jgi:hypothetical protein
MKSDRLVIFAVLFLSVGVGLIFGYCHGSTGLSFSTSVAETKLAVDITTMGAPVLAGVPLIGLGALLLFLALIAAIVSQFRPREPQRVADEPVKRREPFGE